MTTKKRRFIVIWACFVLIMFPTAGLNAQSVSGDSESKVTLESLLPIHRSAASEYDLRIKGATDRKLTLNITPVTQWTNIRRSGGQLGHVFVWLDGEEPAAMAAIFSFPWRGEVLQRRVVHELHALSPEKLNVKRTEPGVLWQPTSGLKRASIPGVSGAATNAGRFKIQSRQISRRFSGHCVDAKGQRWELRVLPTPLMVYPIGRAKEQGFGAIVGMMGDVGSDLESGCIIEAVKKPGDQSVRWQFAPIRMTDMETHLSFDGQSIWDSVRSETDTSFFDTPKVYFRFQDKTVPMTEGS